MGVGVKVLVGVGVKVRVGVEAQPPATETQLLAVAWLALFQLTPALFWMEQGDPVCVSK